MMFGQSANNFGNQANQGTGIFGMQQQQQQQGNNPFSNKLGSPQQTGAFGNNNTNSFAKPFNNQQTSPQFGFNTNNQNSNQNVGMFGNNNNTNPLLGSPPALSKNTSGIFGNNINAGNNMGNNTFLGANNTNLGGFSNSNANVQGNLGGIGFASNSNNAFNMFNKTNTTPPNNTSFNAFGGVGSPIGGNIGPAIGSNIGSFNSNAKPWGQTTGFNQMSGAKFTPVKSRNPKLDGKHVVKSIAQLQQNQYCCQKELRTKYLLSGGNPMMQAPVLGNPSFQTPTTSSFGFGNLGNPQTQQSPQLQQTAAFGNTFMNKNIQQPQMFGGSFNTGQQTQMPFGQTSQPTQGSNPFAPQSQNQNNNSFFNNMTSAIFGGNKTNNPSFNTNQTPFGNQGVATATTFGNAFGNIGQQQQPQQTQAMNPGLMNNNNNIFFTGNQNLNNATLNLANSLFGPPTSQQQQQFQQTPNMSFGQFNQNLGANTTPNLSNTTYNFVSSLLGATTQNQNMQSAQTNYQTMLLNSFFSSDLFQNILNQNNKKNDPYEALSTRLIDGANKTVRSSLSYLGDQDNEEFQKFDTNYARLKKAKKTVDFYKSPYFFNQIQNTPYDWKRNKYTGMKHKLEGKVGKSNPKNNQQLLKKTPLDGYQQVFDRFKNKTLKQIVAKPDQLPINDIGYNISPNLQKLAQMTSLQLRNVYNVSIDNKFGCIKFKQPINLYKKKLSQCIEIVQDSIQIYNEDWEGKRCEIIFKNFSEFKDASELDKRKIQRKMRRWTDKNNMSIITFDKTNGNLTVEVCF